MNDLERQLERALARREPPPWFEAKVLAAAREPKTRLLRLRWLAAALATLLIVSGSAWEYERQERERKAGEAAKAQLELALKVTTKTLYQIQQQVQAVQEGD
jgi:hypothetical protein